MVRETKKRVSVRPAVRATCSLRQKHGQGMDRETIADPFMSIYMLGIRVLVTPRTCSYRGINITIYV